MVPVRVRAPLIIARSMSDAASLSRLKLTHEPPALNTVLVKSCPSAAPSALFPVARVHCIGRNYAAHGKVLNFGVPWHPGTGSRVGALSPNAAK